MSAKKAKSGSDTIAVKTRQDCRWFEPILRDLRGLYQRKLADNLVEFAARETRTIDRWMAGETAPDGAAFFNLLTSRIGEHVLLAVLKACPHRWAEEWRYAHQIVVAQRDKRAADRKFENLMRGVDS